MQSNNDSDLSWMAGLYWQEQELGFQTDIISALPNPMGPSGTNATEYGEESENLGIFAALAYDLLENLTVEYGIRYNDVQKDAFLWEVDSYIADASGNRISNTGRGRPGRTPASAVPNGTQGVEWSGLLSQMVAGDRCLGETPNNDDCLALNLAAGTPKKILDAWGDTDLSINEDEVTQQFSVNWRFSDNANLFFRYAEAYKPGGFSRGNSSFVINTKGEYAAEQAESIEIGGNLRFANGQGQASLTLFTTDYTNRQVTAGFDDPVTGATTFIFINAADSTIEGLEGRLAYVTANRIRMNLGFNYNKGKFDSYENAACFRAEVRQGLCPNGLMDLSGTDFDGQPDWNLVAAVGYEFGLGNGLLMDLAVDASIYDDFDRSRRYSDQLPYDFREQKGYALINARAALYPENRNWEVALWGRNLLDELYWQTQPDQVGIFGTARANVSRPLTYGATFRYNFGG